MKLRLRHILGLFFIFATILVFLVPVYEEPDEPNHLDYINYVAVHHRLPDQLIADQTSIGEGHQAPLYYVVGAAFDAVVLKDNTIDIKPVLNKNYVANGGTQSAVPLYKHLSSDIFASRSDEVAFYALRMFSVLCGILTLAVAYRIAGFFLAQRHWRLAAVFFMATLPQFIFNSAGISNDSLTTLLSSLVILSSLTLLKKPQDVRAHIRLGLVLGLAILAKKTALFLAVVVIVEYVYLLWRAAAPVRARLFGYGALAGALALVIASPYFLHNVISYHELLGSKMELATIPSISGRSVFSSYFITPFIPGLIASSFGAFGWITFKLPAPFLGLYALIVLVGAVGFAWSAYRRSREKAGLTLGLLYIAGAFASLVAINLHLNQSQGRTLFPSLSLIAVFGTFGLSGLLERYLSPRTRKVVVGLLVAFFLVCDLFMFKQIHTFYAAASQYL